MKVKFRYNSYPVYSKNYGKADNVEVFGQHYVCTFSKDRYCYNSKGYNLFDKLYCVVPFKYSKLYSSILLILGLIVCYLWARTAYFETYWFYSATCAGCFTYFFNLTIKVLLRTRKSRKDYINYEQL